MTLPSGLEFEGNVAYLHYPEVAPDQVQELLDIGLVQDALWESSYSALLILVGEDREHARAKISMLIARYSQPDTLMVGSSPRLISPDRSNPLLLSAFLTFRVPPYEDNSELATRLRRSFADGGVDSVIGATRERGEWRRFEAVLLRLFGRDRTELERQSVSAVAASRVDVSDWIIGSGIPPVPESRRQDERRRDTRRAYEGSLQRIARRRNVEEDDAIRAAVTTLDWIDNELEVGSRFYLTRRGVRRRIRFPR